MRLRIKVIDFFLMLIFCLIFFNNPDLYSDEIEDPKNLTRVPRIQCSSALQLFMAKKAILIDTQADGNKSPIVGAIGIPLNKIRYGKAELKIRKNFPIICF